jgi:uncharacterized protein with von Willebrand factor type A (vWA) domain
LFIDFFYTLRDLGVPVAPTAFLTLHRALAKGLIRTLDDFYTAARAILVKSERYFDLYDQVFAHHFKGAELTDAMELELDELARALLDQWLQDPKTLADALGVDPADLVQLSPEELIAYFKARLQEQTVRHDGGNRWIGTGGTSPTGHSGFHPGGLRVGGVSRSQSAVKVAMSRRYRDYSLQGPFTRSMMREALKRLRHLRPAGPKDRVNIDKTIYQTMKNAGEIEIVFERGLKDRLKVILAIDNGGWSMDPYIPLVQALFDYSRSQFKSLTTLFFHNTIYDTLWQDPARYRKPRPIREFARLDPETRLIVVGDASMAPFELMAQDGSIHIEERSGRPSIECLDYLARTFRHCVWLNPTPGDRWPYTRTIGLIARIIPMFELTIDGLEKAVAHLMGK